MKYYVLLALLLSGCAGTGKIPGSTDSTTDANLAIASGAAGSEVWLGQLQRGGNWAITGLKNVTTRPGYDNQPVFAANSRGVYYVSIRDGQQADLYMYEPIIGAGHRHTASPQSEFSPTPMPNGRGLSVVRVEADGGQGLWSYADGRPINLLPGVDNVGYFTWLDSATVALFLVADPPQLAIADVISGKLLDIPSLPGRSLLREPATGALVFVDKSDAAAWWITRYDHATGQLSRIAPALPDSEDLAFTPDGELLMASGRKVFVWLDEWMPVADLSDKVAGKITRITVAPDGRQIALAAGEGGQ